MSISFLPTLLPLVSAHLIADFLLQTKRDIRDKHRPAVLLKHVALVTAISYLLLGVPGAWLVAVGVFASHLGIDYLKIRSGRDDLYVFSMDQLAHLVTLGLIAALAPWPAERSIWIRAAGYDYYTLLVMASAIILTIRTGAIVVDKAVAPFLAKLDSSAAARGFEEGGRLIGQLERALILLFVLANHLTAVGFLIAAKSVLRFGEVRDRENRMEAEYIIIGTLISFLWGLTVAYLTRWFITGMT
jgi:hypothetical protein